VQKRDSLSLRSDSRLLVDELHAGRPAALQRCVEIVDGKADVMDSRSALSHKPRYGRAGIVGLQQLHQGLPRGEPDYARPIRIIESRLGQTQDVPEERNTPCEGLNCDPNMGYSGATWG